MQKRYTFLLAIVLLGGMLSPWWHDAIPTPKITSMPSDGGEENREQRAEWERRRLADPATGRIPEGIEFLERQFLASRFPAAGERGPGAADWASRGPWNVGGRTRALAFDVTNENRMLAGGVSGGIWLTEDGGQSWMRTTALSAHPGVVSVAQDTRAGHTDTWYYLSGEIYGTSASGGNAFYLGDGLYKSTDGGLSWAAVTSTAGGNPHSFTTFYQSGWRVITDPVSANDVVYMATLGAVYRSANGGTSWTAVRGGSTSAYSYFTDVAISPTGVLYATLSSDGPHKGLWRSLNGTTWTNITPSNFPATYDRIVIGINPDNENEVYFFGSTPGFGHYNNYIESDDWTSLWKYTYVSGDGSGAGGTWADLSGNLPNVGTEFDRFAAQGGYDLVVRVQPGFNGVFIGGTNIYRSTDGFTTANNTTHIGGYKPGTYLPYFELYPNHHPDIHDLLFLPSNPNVLYSASDGGVHRTDEANASTVEWTNLGRGYQTSQFYTTMIEHTIPGDPTILGGLQDNGNFITTSSDPTAFWRQTINGDGAFGAIADNFAYYVVSIQLGKVAKATIDNAGNVTAYQRIDPIGPTRNDYMFINPLALDPADQNILYLPAGRRLYRQDQLATLPLNNEWDSIATGWTQWPDTVVGADAQISAIGVSQANPVHRVYIGSSTNRIYRIDNAHTGTPTWQQLPSPAGGATAYVTCIAVDPVNADHVVLAYSNYAIYSLWESFDAGSTWRKVGGNLETSFGGTGAGPSLRWVSILPFPDGTRKYFVGTSVGLFSADTLIQHTVTQAGTQWTQEGVDQIGASVVNHLDLRPVDGLVVAATHGNGMFAANFAPSSSTGEPGVAAPTVRVWPNPARDVAYFKLDRLLAADLRLFDGSGRLMRRGAIATGNGRLDLSGLPDGVYQYEITGKSWRHGGQLIVR